MVVGEILEERELIIIGGGPGGYSAAIRAAQLGMEVTLVEKGKPGGICLHHGCIPSKVLTQAASKFKDAKNLEEFGISVGEAEFSFERWQNKKKNVVDGLSKGVEGLLKANGVEVIQGTASFTSNDKIGIEQDEKFEAFRFENAIIATGSTPLVPEFLKELHERILSPYSVFQLEELPEHLVVYGSDYISLEIATSFRMLGSNVTLVLDDKKDTFEFDNAITKELTRVLKKNKIKLIKGSEVKELKTNENGVQLTVHSSGETITIEGSHFFYSVGHRPNLENVGIQFSDVTLNEEGFIEINNQCQTSVPSIFAIGDITAGPAFANKAAKQGKTAAECLAGIPSEHSLALIPTVVHTAPPIAAVGLTEEEAAEEGYHVKTGQFSMAGNGFASIIGKKDGVMKLVSDAETDRVLGFHVMSEGAIELIDKGVLAMEMVARDEDIMYPYYPHPSLNEGWLEASEALKEKAIHIPPAKKKKPVSTN
ncbi:dihydrolipoyl dehydrogenase [Pseudalkalibacillus caeni]|uniref:Dihydrolipoyl dehydrogenase n=1 Tax=Exobacillus caeni TaxID=2574798 RepID=A0A5R9F504_9BACL|nr:dihydrolipoyl dehydrogenase [Pseudalkalibacillus caeni]TLS38111.1 dihydrolipoyl dehydrogenase [Pseudalkalibacillus caeni]